MRNEMKIALKESVQGLLNLDLPVAFDARQLRQLGIAPPAIVMGAERIQAIRKQSQMSQAVFAQVLNVSISTVRQWEQGKRSPTGATQVLLELLEKIQHHSMSGAGPALSRNEYNRCSFVI